MEVLPRHTDKFSEYFTPTSMVLSGTTVTVTKTAHGLTDGQLVSITEADFINPITNIDDTGDYPLFTATGDTDLTQGYNTAVRLSSASSPSIDGDYTLQSVVDRTNFELNSFPNTGLTDVVLHEDRELGVNGLYNITKIDADSFSYEITQGVGTTLSIDATSAKIHNEVRITGGSDIDRVLKTYETQLVDKLWGFVVLDNTLTSKDSQITTDAQMEQKNQNFWRCFYLSPFSFYVFIPTNNKLTGRFARDEAEDLRPYLFKSLLNATFDTGFTLGEAENFVAPLGDGRYEYKETYYIHQFQFQQTANIGQDDVYNGSVSRNFNNIQLNVLDEVYEEVIQSTSIDLD